MDLKTSQALKHIRQHLHIRRFLTVLCYISIVGGILVYVFYAVNKQNHKFKLVADAANNPSHYKMEKIMRNPHIKFQHNDNQIYQINAKKAIHKDDEEVVLYDVKAAGEMGSITAGELNVSEDGDHLVFSQNPVLTLNKTGDISK